MKVKELAELKRKIIKSMMKITVSNQEYLNAKLDLYRSILKSCEKVKNGTPDNGRGTGKDS